MTSSLSAGMRVAFCVIAFAFAWIVGCVAPGESFRGLKTPVQDGINTNNLIDPVAQPEADNLGNPREWFEVAERLRKQPTPEQLARRKSVLCLSGGGSYGAFTAGVMCGWTETGDRPGTNGRPPFDVVTGISTGALIAPLVFLGPQYDGEVKKFYTTVESRDIYHFRPVRGLFSDSLADTTPLARLVDQVMTDRLICEIAAEHRAGRRLYIGTTELEGHRFVFWDIGEIANRGCPGDRELICKILLGSSAIPGFFPPSRIPVTVDGKPYYELHGDGGVSQAIFFRPPYVPPAERNDSTRDLAGTDLYMVLAGKIYADAAPRKARSLTLAGSSVSGVLYAQARGDLQRMYLVSMLTGMNYHLCSIPADFPAPTSSAAFERKEMTAMFEEGVRLAKSGNLWRRSPPGVDPGESALKRGGTALTESVRGPGLVVPIRGPAINPLAQGRLPIPVTPDTLVK